MCNRPEDLSLYNSFAVCNLLRHCNSRLCTHVATTGKPGGWNIEDVRHEQCPFQICREKMTLKTSSSRSINYLRMQGYIQHRYSCYNQNKPALKNHDGNSTIAY